MCRNFFFFDVFSNFYRSLCNTIKDMFADKYMQKKAGPPRNLASLLFCLKACLLAVHCAAAVDDLAADI